MFQAIKEINPHVKAVLASGIRARLKMDMVKRERRFYPEAVHVRRDPSARPRNHR